MTDLKKGEKRDRHTDGQKTSQIDRHVAKTDKQRENLKRKKKKDSDTTTSLCHPHFCQLLTASVTFPVTLNKITLQQHVWKKKKKH